ncbi:hypothetical protein C8R46DRAFT_1069022 [Mycena filopes]|nr:hypothetical protein C8R46DRAFT_1069022 [Mycena filopes]
MARTKMRATKSTGNRPPRQQLRCMQASRGVLLPPVGTASGDSDGSESGRDAGSGNRNSSNEGDETGEDSASSYSVEDVYYAETSERRNSGASTPVADLWHELHEVRARIKRDLAHKIRLLERLRQLGDPADEEEDLKQSNLVKENERLASELSTERAERQRVEETLGDVIRECREPLVVPELLNVALDIEVPRWTGEISPASDPLFHLRSPSTKQKVKVEDSSYNDSAVKSAAKRPRSNPSRTTESLATKRARTTPGSSSFQRQRPNNRPVPGTCIVC